MKRITDLLNACGTENGVLPPTALYNEGWMLRLVLDFCHRKPGQGPFPFLPGSRWYSEILLRSPFLARNRGDRFAESWTHADGAIGHFDVGGSGWGDLAPHNDAKQLTIFEGKMFSGLSSGTRNAPNFDQAARTVACISEVLRTKEIDPASMEQLGFFVLAPKEQIESGIFIKLLQKTNISEKVRNRAEQYGDEKQDWYKKNFLPALDAIHISEISWEQVVENIMKVDIQEGAKLSTFLSRCIQYNRRVLSNPRDI